MRFRSPALDELLLRARRETDRARRIALYHEVQRLVARELPVLSLWHEDNVALMGRNLSGYRVQPTAQLTALATTLAPAQIAATKTEF